MSATNSNTATNKQQQERILFGVEWRRIAPTVKLDQSEDIEVINNNNNDGNKGSSSSSNSTNATDQVIYEQQQQVQQSLNNLSINNNNKNENEPEEEEEGDDVNMEQTEEEEAEERDDDKSHINVNFILESPPSRYMHSCTLMNQNSELFIFGGYGIENMLKDVYIFNIQREEWRLVPFTTNDDNDSAAHSSLHLSARYGHSAVCYNNKVYVFGGRSEVGYLSDLIEFDVKQLKWKSVALTPAANNKNKTIPGRSLHSAVVDQQGFMYVYGGSDDDTIYSELIKIDLNRGQWEILSSGDGAVPSARDQHSAVLYKNETMYVFGGISEDVLSDLWQYHIPSNKWTLVQSKALLSSFRPTERAGHVACISDEENMIIVGGEDPNTVKYYDDIYAFHIPTQEWVQMKQKNNFSAGSHTRSAYVNNKMFLFGGYSVSSGPQDDFCMGTVKPIKRQQPQPQQQQ